jgi:hypothetical protein
MICAGYVYLDLPKRDSTPQAEEGTAAGEYLERLLTRKPIGETSSSGFYFDNDIKFYITPIAEDIKRRGSSNISCEHRIDWQTQSGITIKGKPDVSFIDNRNRLCIEDLKYGWGIVEVEENWQLIGYAIGEVIKRGQAFNEISLKILQPRPHHEDGSTREWLISYSKLLEYKERIERRMQEIADGKKELQTSSQCKYCQGTGEACPAFNRLFYRSLEITTEFYQDSIENDELATQLDQIKRAEEVIKIKKDSLLELGNIRIKEGQIIPNYSQSTTYSNRKWKKGISPEAIQLMTGKNVIENVFMSPAKVEKLGVSKELVAQLSETQFTGYKLERNKTNIGNQIFGNTNPNGGN